MLFTSDTVQSSEYYDDARIEAVRPATGERTVVLEGSSQARFLAPDHLLFARAGTIFAVRFDARQLKTAGTPVPLLQSVSTEVSSGAVRFATASSGAALWIPGELGKLRRQFVWVEPGGAATPVDLPVDRYLQLALAPDERRLVASIDASPCSLARRRKKSMSLKAQAACSGGKSAGSVDRPPGGLRGCTLTRVRP